jgi:hypothetical protein
VACREGGIVSAAAEPAFIAALKEHKARSKRPREKPIAPRPGARFYFYYSGDSVYEQRRVRAAVDKLKKLGVPSGAINIETLDEHIARKRPAREEAVAV